MSAVGDCKSTVGEVEIDIAVLLETGAILLEKSSVSKGKLMYVCDQAECFPSQELY